MTNSKDLTRISKVLSLVLRHQPESIGIALDQQGWADVALQIRANHGHSVPVELSYIDHVPVQFLERW